MRNGTPELLIIEPFLDGHHGAYVQWIVRGAIARGVSVRLATSKDSVVHPHFRALQDEFKSDLMVLTLPEMQFQEMDKYDVWSLIKKEWYYFKLFRCFYRDNIAVMRPDVVMLPYLDYCINVMAICGSPFGKTPLCGIAFRPAFHFKGMNIKAQDVRFSWARKFLFLRLLADPVVKTLFTMDDTLHRCVGNMKLESSAKLRCLPAPAELAGTVTRQAARRRLGIARETVCILVYGAITARKGFDALLLAASEGRFPENVHIILAGRQDAWTTDFLASPAMRNLLASGRVHQCNEFLDKDMENAVFAASDIVWLGYRGHSHGSGVLVQAGRMGLPVVACDDGLIGWLTRRGRFGVTVCIADMESVVAGVNEMLRDKGQCALYGQNGWRFFASHTPEHFSKALFDSILTIP